MFVAVCSLLYSLCFIYFTIEFELAVRLLCINYTDPGKGRKPIQTKERSNEDGETMETNSIKVWIRKKKGLVFVIQLCILFEVTALGIEQSTIH